jgi:hypothetical protein
MKDDDECEEGQKDDGEETEEEEEDTEDPFVDNLIAQLDDLRNKASNGIAFKLWTKLIRPFSNSGLKQKRDVLLWKQILDSKLPKKPRQN